MLITLFQKCRYIQYVAAFTATLTSATAGMYSTWPSPSLPKLTSNDSPIGATITSEQGSWVASIYVLSMTITAPFTRFIMEKLGPKYTVLFSALPSFIGWILCIFANSAVMLIIGRLIGGFGGGIGVAVVPMYIGEISSKDIRGRLGALFNIVKLCGSLFVLTVGPYVSYNVLTWCCSGFSIIFAIVFIFMPESPYHCIRKGNRKQAEKNLIRLCSNYLNKEELKAEMNEIEFTVDNDTKNRGGCLDIVSKKEYLFPLGIVIVIKTIQQMSGLNAIESYLQTIIEVSTSSITPEISSIISGCVQLPAAIAAMVLIERLGRKTLFLTSAVCCGLSLTAEGVYFYLQNVKHNDMSNISWLPTTALIFFLIMNPIGLSTVPYVLMGEMFATNMKSTALSISMGYGGLIAFLTTKFFMPISNEWGMHTTFWIFAGFCFGGTILTYCILPETKRKTFEEIQRKFRFKKDSS